MSYYWLHNIDYWMVNNLVVSPSLQEHWIATMWLKRDPYFPLLDGEWMHTWHISRIFSLVFKQVAFFSMYETSVLLLQINLTTPKFRKVLQLTRVYFFLIYGPQDFCYLTTRMPLQASRHLPLVPRNINAHMHLQWMLWHRPILSSNFNS